MSILKVMKYSFAFVLMPEGIGILDELFEVLTLYQLNLQMSHKSRFFLAHWSS